MRPLIAITAVVALAVAVGSGCGGSDAPTTSSAAGGAPASDASGAASAVGIQRAGDGQATLRVNAPGAERVDARVTFRKAPGDGQKPVPPTSGASVRGGAPVSGGVAEIPLGPLPAGTYTVAMVQSLAGGTHRAAVATAVAPQGGGVTRSSQSDNVYANDAIRQKLSSKPSIITSTCNSQRNYDEFICMRISNYVLAWQKGTPPLLGDSSVAWLEGDQAVTADWFDQGGSGKYHSGPPTQSTRRWQDYKGKDKGLTFATSQPWEINFDDNGDNEVSGRVVMTVDAGAVTLGRIQLDGYNDGQETHGHSKCLEGGTWSRFVTCTYDGQGHGPQEGSQDYKDEIVLGYFLQSFPVRVSVSNRLPNSRLTIEGITSPGTFVNDATVSTLKSGMVLDNIDAPEQVELPRITTLQGQPVTMPKPGDALKCTAGRWTGKPTITRAWTADGSPIAGATGEQLRLASGQAGAMIGCTVTAKNAKASVEAHAEEVGPVAGAQAGTGTTATTEAATGTDTTAPASDATGTAPAAPGDSGSVATGWLVGWRTFNARESIVIRGRLTSLSDPPEKAPWVNSPVTITVALASSGTGAPPDPEKAKDATWSSCGIGKSSESGSKAECVVDSATPGGPGSLNEVAVEIRR